MDIGTALILGLSERQLKKNQEHQLKEMLKMTNVVREIEQEALQKGRKEGRKEVSLELARKLLAEGESHERVAHLTGLSLAEIKQLATTE